MVGILLFYEIPPNKSNIPPSSWGLFYVKLSVFYPNIKSNSKIPPGWFYISYVFIY
jgi:hypothetical protein